jgi:hypothetical protein
MDYMEDYPIMSDLPNVEELAKTILEDFKGLQIEPEIEGKTFMTYPEPEIEPTRLQQQQLRRKPIFFEPPTYQQTMPIPEEIPQMYEEEEYQPYYSPSQFEEEEEPEIQPEVLPRQKPIKFTSPEYEKEGMIKEIMDEELGYISEEDVPSLEPIEKESKRKPSYYPYLQKLMFGEEQMPEKVPISPISRKEPRKTVTFGPSEYKEYVEAESEYEEIEGFEEEIETEGCPAHQALIAPEEQIPMLEVNKETEIVCEKECHNNLFYPKLVDCKLKCHRLSRILKIVYKENEPMSIEESILNRDIYLNGNKYAISDLISYLYSVESQRKIPHTNQTISYQQSLNN